MWQVDNRTPFAAERGWVRDRNGTEVWLVTVKCTFDIKPDGSTEVSEEQPPVLREGWFEQTWGGYRHMIRLPTGGPGKHRVRLELLAEKHPDSTGNDFRLLCVGTAGK